MFRLHAPTAILAAATLAFAPVVTGPAMSQVARIEAASAKDELYDSLGIDRMVSVVREEGVAYALDLEAAMFPGRGGAGWESTVERIYDEAALKQAFRVAFSSAMPAEHVPPVLEFFTTDAGQDIVAREIEARTALIDPEMERTALESWRAMQADDDPRIPLIEAFIAENDLIDANVAGAMNSNLAFWMGLSDGSATDLTERDMLADVWAQEPGIRADTESWIHAFTALAYGGLPEGTLSAYVELSTTPEGRALNAALFTAFDTVFEDLSRTLGRAAARIVGSQDI